VRLTGGTLGGDGGAKVCFARDCPAAMRRQPCFSRPLQ
jgi:hypothetical protein